MEITNNLDNWLSILIGVNTIIYLVAIFVALFVQLDSSFHLSHSIYFPFFGVIECKPSPIKIAHYIYLSLLFSLSLLLFLSLTLHFAPFARFILWCDFWLAIWSCRWMRFSIDEHTKLTHMIKCFVSAIVHDDRLFGSRANDSIVCFSAIECCNRFRLMFDTLYKNTKSWVHFIGRYRFSSESLRRFQCNDMVVLAQAANATGIEIKIKYNTEVSCVVIWCTYAVPQMTCTFLRLETIVPIHHLVI